MLNNIKLIGIIFLSVLLLTNCKKEAKQDTTQSPGELVFAPMDGNTEKDGFDILCIDGLVVHHAQVKLNDNFYYPLTFILGDKLYTQSIKLPPGAYTIQEFSLMTEDDIIVKATPMWNSDYAGFVTDALLDPDGEYGFTIVEFEKIEVAIDVLCYIPAEYDNFGFVWFDVTQITIREQCFFGDFCVYDLDLYGGSLYGPLVTVDEVAIYKIRVYRDQLFVDEFYNTYDEGNGLMYNSPLCIEYADYDLEDNHFDFELWIYVDNGGTFEYVLMHTWGFNNAETIVPLYDVLLGEDGVVEFVLGECVLTPTDLLLPSWPWSN